jgi:hypothetical protein
MLRKGVGRRERKGRRKEEGGRRKEERGRRKGKGTRLTLVQTTHILPRSWTLPKD